MTGLCWLQEQCWGLQALSHPLLLALAAQQPQQGLWGAGHLTAAVL
jgi:hypothetical protein